MIFGSHCPRGTDSSGPPVPNSCVLGLGEETRILGDGEYDRTGLSTGPPLSLPVSPTTRRQLGRPVRVGASNPWWVPTRRELFPFVRGLVTGVDEPGTISGSGPVLPPVSRVPSSPVHVLSVAALTLTTHRHTAHSRPTHSQSQQTYSGDHTQVQHTHSHDTYRCDTHPVTTYTLRNTLTPHTQHGHNTESRDTQMQHTPSDNIHTQGQHTHTVHNHNTDTTHTESRHTQV